MKLAVVGFLAAVVAAPLAAEAAESQTRWAVTLSGRMVASYSYIRTERETECMTSRYGTSSRELRIASVRPTVVTVARSSGGARYRPASLLRLRVTPSIGRGSWSEMQRCLGDPTNKGFGSCPAATQASRRIRAAFGWGGPNRLVFRARRGMAPPLGLCGIDTTVPSRDEWLSLAPGRVDEEALITGSRRRVVARAELTRDANLRSDTPATQVSQKVTVVWTLRFLRVG